MGNGPSIVLPNLSNIPLPVYTSHCLFDLILPYKAVTNILQARPHMGRVVIVAFGSQLGGRSRSCRRLQERMSLT